MSTTISHSEATSAVESPTSTPSSFPPNPGSGAAVPSSQPANESRLPPALTVRLGVMRRILLAVSGMDGHRRWRFAFTSFVGAAQVVAFIVILAISYNKPCDQNLSLYLILLIVRISLSFPSAFWSAISPRPSRRDTPERREELERNRLVGSRQIDRRIKKVADLVSLYGLIVFLVGNIWIISSNTCSTTNPVLYKGALAGLILSWLWILEFFLLCAFAIFCLPILLFGIRHWGWGEKKHEVGPLKKHDISKLPRRIFVGTLPEEAASPPIPGAATLEPVSNPKPDQEANNPNASSTSSPSRGSKSKPQWWRLYRSSRSRPSPSTPSSPTSSSSPLSISQYPPFPPKTLPIELPESQNACSICLSEYEVPPLKESVEAKTWEPETLVLLPCKHAFHEACLVDWLAVSGRCALCQTPVFPPKPSKPNKTSSSPATPANPIQSTSTTAPVSTPTTQHTTTPVPVEDQHERDRTENLV